MRNQCSQQLWRLRLLVKRPRRPAFVLMTGPLPDGYPSLRASHGPQAAYREGADAVSAHPYRGVVTTVYLPDQLSPAIVRPRPHVEAVLAQSLHEMGPRGRTALAWQWALTGTRPSPVTLSLAPGSPPSREEILAEAAAEAEGSTAPHSTAWSAT